jgi:hypothetical protein
MTAFDVLRGSGFCQAKPKCSNLLWSYQHLKDREQFLKLQVMAAVCQQMKIEFNVLYNNKDFGVLICFCLI